MWLYEQNLRELCLQIFFSISVRHNTRTNRSATRRPSMKGAVFSTFSFQNWRKSKARRIDFTEKRNEKVARCLGQKLSWWKYKFSQPCWLHPLIIGASYSYTCKIQGLVMQMCLLAHFTNARFVTLILPSYSYFWRWRSLNSISV